MKRFSWLLPLLPLLACDGLLSVDFDDARARAPQDDGGTNPDSATSVDDSDVPLVPANKVDLLLAVDNSPSMGDKSKLLAKSVGKLIEKVSKTGDLHVGIISSSLGNLGGDVCPSTGRNNDRAHLLGPGVLSFKSGQSLTTFTKSVEDAVRAVDQTGCGLEAQLEATYRFLVQPDPWVTVRLNAGNQADLGDDVDFELLKQRADFLRPDSALVVVLLTDEDDSSADPLAIGGLGWGFAAKNFPGSKVYRGTQAQGTTAPRGTSICATNAASSNCTSCGFQATCSDKDSTCQFLKNDPNCKQSGAPGVSGEGYDGFYGSSEEELNVRFHRMKERFGIDPQFPLQRYIMGLTSSRAPNRKSEHPTKDLGSVRREISDYVHAPTCTNPIFAAKLPTEATDTSQLCNLERGPRSRELVVFAVLGGVPEQLATASPDWEKIVGRDPAKYDYTGIDLHMIQSLTPRPGLPPPSATRGDNGIDPIHGREWDTQGADLQYACTFGLTDTRTCETNMMSCDCVPGEANPPLCAATGGTQIRAKAYPSIRPLRVAQGLGNRGVIGSICAAGGYDNTMELLGQRVVTRLAQ